MYENCSTELHALLHRHLGREYALVTSISIRGGVRLFVFVKVALAYLVTQVDASSVTCGPIVDNKGGVAVSFFVRHTSFAFVNSHLAAHQVRRADSK